MVGLERRDVLSLSHCATLLHNKHRTSNRAPKVAALRRAMSLESSTSNKKKLSIVVAFQKRRRYY
jgi:hypothetical protein